MTDYTQIGFKCGLEIHQQLEGKKLFCDCPTSNTDKKPDVSFQRKLHAVAGETGEVDIAAAHEMKKQKRFFYQGHTSDTCLVDYDEEPVKVMNKEALETALKVALLLNAQIVDEIQVMRKTVIDGSNVSGFQRTALIAENGFVETPQGKVGIPTICLEEEACQKLEDGKDFVRYKLDRLGIPLIEIATDASIKNDQHAKETASHIGMILRSVDGVKRGLGTIRQDVNVSIKGGARIEIKGFQDLKSIPKVIAYEIERQQKEIKEGTNPQSHVRKAEQDFTTTFLRPMPGAARMYPETDVPPIAITKPYLDAIELPKLLTEKTAELEKKYNLSKELAKEVHTVDYFDELVKKNKKVEPSMIANIVVTIPKEIKSRLKEDASKLTKEDFSEIIGYLNEGKITKDAVIDLLVKKIKKEKIDLKAFETISDAEIEKEIEKIVKAKPGLNMGAYMGLLMGKYRGKVDGKKLTELLKKHI